MLQIYKIICIFANKTTKNNNYEEISVLYDTFHHT